MKEPGEEKKGEEIERGEIYRRGKGEGREERKEGREKGWGEGSVRGGR